MSKIHMIKEPKRQALLPRRLSLIAALAFLSSASATSMCFGQSSSDYHPGEGIKFHDMSGGSSSSSSASAVSTSPTTTTSSTPPAAANSSVANSLSGATSDAATGSETGEKGLGSFLKNVVRAGAQVGNVQQSNYGGGQSQSYGSNYGSAPQSYRRPSNFGVQPNYNTTRPDLVQGGNPFPGRQSAFSGQQNQPHFSGSAMELVTNNPPGPVSGDIENLIPREIHTKAYGPELHRNGPLNGAEDNTHLF